MQFLAFIPLVDFSPIKPDFGLFFWSTFVFLIFWLLIGKLAFKPIIKALKDRQTDIQTALDTAKTAKAEVANLKSENEKIIAEARDEKMKIVKEAKESANLLIAEAKDKAKEEAQRILVQAKLDIENAKKAAMVDVKNQVGQMALQIAEKVIRKELADKQPQQDYVNRLVDEIKLN